MDSSSSQHDSLRKRLEEEVSLLKSQTDNTDYDWFIRAVKSPFLPSLKPPNSDNVNVNSNRSKPTTETSDTGLLKRNGDDFLVDLSRSRTADAKLMSSGLSRSSTNSSANNNNALRRTSTNIANSDVGTFKQKKQAFSPPQSTISPTFPLESQPKKKGFFKKLFGGGGSNSGKNESLPPVITVNSNKHSSTNANLKSPKSPKSLKESDINNLNPLSRYSSPKVNAQKQFMSDGSESNSTVNSSFSLTSSDRKALMVDSSSAPAKKIDSIPLSEQFKVIDSQLSSYLKELEDFDEGDIDPLIAQKNQQLAKVFSATADKKSDYSKDIIPPHPNKPAWPSALSNHPKYGGSIEKEIFLKNKREREQSSMFGNLLHKTKTESPDLLLLNGSLNESDDTPPFNFEPLKYTSPPPKIEKRPPLKTLSSLKPMKKVAFATTTFVHDPPQQIPSRNPRKGNVELMPNGELLIHKIDPQDKLNSATGIVVGGSVHLKLVPQSESTSESSHSISNEQGSSTLMKKTGSTASMTSTDQTIRAQDKDAAAQRAREKQKIDDIDVQKEGIKIDKPMIKRRRSMDKPLVTLKMDELYTRCCHLREILPIPATLKQIPKGSTDPIPFLHLRNPRPSMIEILSFTDFVRIAPIICVALDGVSLTNEMFRIVLSALMYKRYLEKVTLRNTPIDTEGWKMLSYFLSMNKALKTLDITQCPTLDVNTQRIRNKNKASAEVRMTCNINDRSDMDWALLTAAIIFRGGIDELILTGCKIPNLSLFSNLLNIGLAKTLKLGLAYNDLTEEHCNIIAEWMTENTSLLGLDLAYNDLSVLLKPFIKFAKFAKLNDNKLAMLSLNTCNLLDCQDTIDLLKHLSQFQNLKYLDFSGNKKLFKTFMNTFCAYLPSLNYLKRLHLDYCELSTLDLVKLFQTIPLMENLNYLSIHGQELDETALVVLCKSLKLSKTLYSVNFDNSSISVEYQERIGLLTIRNVERQLYQTQGSGLQKSILEIVSKLDKESLKKQLNLPNDMSFTEFLYNTIKKDAVDVKEVEKVIKITTQLKTKMRAFSKELMDMYIHKQLNTDGIEILMKLITLDSSITQAIELLGDSVLSKSNDGSSYDQLLTKLGEHGVPDNSNNEIVVEDELLESIKQFEKDPVKGKDQFTQALSHAKDPVDIVNLLRQCQSKNFSLSDLYVKSIKDGDDKGSKEDDTDEKDNKEVLKAYDSILADYAKTSEIK